MSNEKKKFQIDHKYFTFFGGIAYSLLAVILVMNIGYFARVVAFPFLYLFGMCSYVIYGLLYANGIFLLFKGTNMKLRPIRIVGLVLVFLAALVLTTMYATDGNIALSNVTDSDTPSFISAFNNATINKLNNEVNGGYFNVNWINIFGKLSSTSDSTFAFGGGFIGYLLTAGLLVMGDIGCTVVGVVVLIAGTLLFFLPDIINAIKKQLIKQGVPVSEDIEHTQLVSLTPKAQKTKKKLKASKEKVRNRDVISTAGDLSIESSSSSVYSEPVNEPVPQSAQPISQPVNNSPFFGGNFLPSSNGVFTPAQFRLSTDPSDNTSNIESNTTQRVVSQPISSPQISNIAPTFSSAIEQEEEATRIETENLLKANEEQTRLEQASTRHEQMNLFDSQESQSYDIPLGSVNPTYREPVAVQKQTPVSTGPIVPEAKERLKFVPPSVDLLNDYAISEEVTELNKQNAEEMKEAINSIFGDFNLHARCSGYTIGPSVTRYNIEYDPQVTIAQVKRIMDDVMMRLGGVIGRFEPIVQGQRYSGLEIPNATTETVSLKEVIKGLPNEPKHALAVGFGKDISGKVITADFNDFPHILVAGTTGSGKSIFTHSIIMTLIMRNSPDDMKLVLIDPKKVEMNLYADLPHLLCPIINEPDIAKQTLLKLCDEMDYRYSLFQKAKVLSIKEYNKWAEENNKAKLPYIIIMFDEYADCVDTCKDISQPVVRIAQKARAAGLHMLIATQRPSVNVVTGVIKGNLPTHVALMTSNATDSMTILGEGGAESLLGRGDMLVQSPLVSRTGSVRCQSPFVDNSEINAVCDYLRENYPVQYDPEYSNFEKETALDVINNIASKGSSSVGSGPVNTEDDMYEDVKEWAMAQDYASMSRIQREFGMGFNRAGKLFRRLQEDGIVAEKPDTASSAKGCRVLVHDKFGEVTYDEQSYDAPSNEEVEDNTI